MNPLSDIAKFILDDYRSLLATIQNLTKRTSVPLSSNDTLTVNVVSTANSTSLKKSYDLRPRKAVSYKV
jgi:hypothetical protein